MIPIVTVLVISILGLACEDHPGQDVYITNDAVTETKELATWIKEFKDDAIAATSLYQDKTIIVKGRVLRVDNGSVGVRLLLGDLSSRANLICQFELNQMQEADKLEPGENVVVKGLCVSTSPGIVLVHCTLETGSE